MTSPPQVKVPVVGKVNKQIVYVGGAAVIGVVGYAYWSRSRATPVAPNDTTNTALGDPTLPTVTTTTIPDNTDVISTNGQWTQRAVEYLSGQGFDGQFVSATLGKFLARRGLTPSEEPVALAALAAYGQPPVGAPYYVVSAPVAHPSPTPTPAARTWTHGHRVLPGETWNSIAAKYRVSPTDLWNHNPNLHRKPNKLVPGWVMLVPTG